jgi:outer membrane immunogenic protein
VGVFSSTQNHNKSGWAAGAGIEYLLTSNATLKIEYLYLHLGSDNIGNLPRVFTINDEMNIHTVRAGLNWRFVTAR